MTTHRTAIAWTDQISQTQLDDKTWKPDEDHLGRKPLVDSALSLALSLGHGAVVSVEGPWGSGKTDVLARMACHARDSKNAHVLWLNPWRRAYPDLLLPTLAWLLERLPEDLKPSNKTSQSKINWKEIGVFVLGAAARLSFSAATFGAGEAGSMALKLLSSMSTEIRALAKEAIAHERATQPQGDDDQTVLAATLLASSSVDAVAHAADAVQKIARLVCGRAPDGTTVRPIVICVDDLDRCLPDRQIAMLEAIHFLRSAGAAITLFVALDERLIVQALRTRYQLSDVDAEGYLNKLFQFRLAVPPAEPKSHQVLMTSLLTGLNVDGQLISDLSQTAAQLPAELNVTPRDLRQIAGRVAMQQHGRASGARGATYLQELVWHWVALRRPALRKAMVGIASHALADIAEARGKVRTNTTAFVNQSGDPAFAARLAVLQNEPALPFVVRALLPKPETQQNESYWVAQIEAFRTYDAKLVAAGL